MSVEWPMKGGNDIKTEEIEQGRKNVKAEAHTNHSDENEGAIGKTANYDGEIIHKLGNATWCDQSNESDQARVEKEEETYSGLTLAIITEIEGKLLLPLLLLAFV